jgi:hypothetical protein
VIFMRRDVDEVVASQRSMLERLGRKGAGLPDEKLRSLLETQVREVTQWMAAQPNFRVLQVEHRDAVYGSAAVAKKVNDFLGGALDEARMAGAADPKLHREDKERTLSGPL